MKNGSLSGVKIVSLAVNLPGPLAASLLNREGADVVKVEPPPGDPLKIYSPDYYRELLGSQRVKTMDLKTSAGREDLDRYLEPAHVLLTSSRPSALEKLGVDWAAVSKRFPRLSMVSIVGHAGRGEEPGHDLTYQAEKGLLSAPNESPRMPFTCWSDIAAAQKAAFAATALLQERQRTGRGGFREIGVTDSLDDFLGPVKTGLMSPLGMLGGAFAGYNIYQTSDGWIALAALEPHFQKNLMGVLGVKRLEAKELKAAFSAKKTREWVSLAEQNDIPLTAVK